MKLRSTSELASTWSMERECPVGTVESTAAIASRTARSRLSGSTFARTMTVRGKPALEHSRGVELSLSGGNEGGGRGRFVEMRFYVADDADDFAQHFADVEVFADALRGRENTCGQRLR